MGDPYREIYTEDYYSGKNSFFYKLTGYKDFQGYFDRLARWFAPHVAGERLLDIGCAYGFLLRRFQGEYELHGIDVSDHAIGEARTLLPEATFHVGALGVEPLPYNDNSLDTMLCTDVLEHLLYEDQPRAAQDMLRVLKPGGRLCVSTPNGGIIRKLFYFIPDRMEHHFGMRNHRGWLTFFGQQGFEIVDYWTYLHGLLPFRWRRGGLPELGFVVRKPPT